jgi:DNA topoisomerase III
MLQIILHVAEKPSAAKEIANVLARALGNGQPQRVGTNVEYVSIWEFRVTFQGRDTLMIFMSVLGHLKGVDIENKFRSWGSCQPIMLLNPHATAIVSAVAHDKEGLASLLKAQSRRATVLFLWLDCDSEGEKIAADVRDVCVEANRSITVKRARFSAMTRTDLMRALDAPVDLDQRVIDMVSTRQELDLRSGAAYTRFFTKQLERFEVGSMSNENQLISYGACQFPTLGLVVDRWLTIKNFVPRPFWVINLRLESCAVQFDWARHRIFDEYTAHTLYELCVDDATALDPPKCARVERVDKRSKDRWRPLPLSTVELQKAASRVLRVTSEATMNAAEALYTSGLISYPRTETDRFDVSYDLQGFVALQTNNPNWGQFAARLQTPATPGDPMTFMQPRAGPNDDHAHPPIHPTSAAPHSFANTDQQRIFEYVTRRFLACCSINARGAETKVQVRVGRAEMFGARGLIVEHKGYLEVMQPYESWSDRNMPRQLLDVGATIPVDELNLRGTQTVPPALLAEADLIALMDRHGIGTDATISEHIKKVIDRDYVKRLPANKFEPTKLGIALVDGLEHCRILLARPGMRSAQEAAFKTIQSGARPAGQVKEEALTQFSMTFARLKQSSVTFNQSFVAEFGAATAVHWTLLQANFSRCGRCDRMMQLKESPNPRRGVNRAVECDECGIFHVPHLGELSAKPGVFCPVCKFQVIQVLNTDTQKSHSVCPCCFNDPPDALNPENKGSKAFRCFSCTHDQCSESAGLVPALCPRCRSPCALRTPEGRNSFLSCKASYKCWTLNFPCVTESVTVTDVRCRASPVCAEMKVHHFVIKLRARQVQPGRPTLFSGCLFCGSAYPTFLASIEEGRLAPQGPHPGCPLNPPVAPPASYGEIEGRGTGRGVGRGMAINVRTSSGSYAPRTGTGSRSGRGGSGVGILRGGARRHTGQRQQRG